MENQCIVGDTRGINTISPQGQPFLATKWASGVTLIIYHLV
jgi:hypothetical protein